MEKLQEADKIIRPIFFNDILMASLPRLWQKMKDLGNGKSPISYEIVKEWYSNQEVVQMYKPLKKPQTIYHIKTSRPLKVVFMDTMFIDNWSMVCIMDLFSKYGHCLPFKRAVTSADTTKTLKSFLEKVNKSISDVVEVRTDGGPEYLGQFAEFVGSKKVKSLPYRKNEMSPVERFNGTMRRFLERIFEVKGKPINWPQKYIPQILQVYNYELKHSSTGYTPIEALMSPKAQTDIRRSQIQSSIPKDIAIGDTVRIVSRDIKNIFDRKIRSNWSKELYTIKDIKGSRITLNDGREFMEYEVLKINPDLLMKQEKDAPAFRSVASNAFVRSAPRKSRAERYTERELRRLN